MIRIAFYLRVSIEDIDSRTGMISESWSITNQRNLLYQYVASQPDLQDSAVIELCDDGFSGTTMNRPGMQKLLKLANSEGIDCIIIKDFSRFARNYLEIADYMECIFPSLGIRVISVNDKYDSLVSNTANRTDLEIRYIFDAYYSMDISIKTRMGKQSLVSKGAYINPFAPFGYKKDEKDKHKLVVDDESANIVRRIFNLAGLGMSVRDITILLNAEKVPTPRKIKNQQGLHHKWWIGNDNVVLWSRNTVTTILRDEKYLGRLIYNKRYRPQVGENHLVKNERSEWIIVENCYEPLITEAEFEAAQEKLKEYQHKDVSRSKIYLYTGKLFCGHCGFALRRNKQTSAIIKYCCMTVKERTDQLGCMTSSILESQISEIVLVVIQTHIKVVMEKQRMLKKEGSSNAITKLQKQLNIYKKSVAMISEKKAELYDDLVDEKISREYFLVKRNEIANEQKEIELKIEELEKKVSDMEQTSSKVNKN